MSAIQSFDATSDRRGLTAQKLPIESPSELAHTIEKLALPARASSSLLSLPPTAKTVRAKAASDAERVQSWTCLLKAGYDNNCEHGCMRRAQAVEANSNREPPDSHLHRLSYWANTELLHDLRSSSTAEDPDSRTADLLARVRDLSAYGGVSALLRVCGVESAHIRSPCVGAARGTRAVPRRVSPLLGRTQTQANRF